MFSQLRFLLNEDKSSYTVSGLADESISHLIIPSEHEGLPVTAIANNAFNRKECLISVEIPSSVTSIGYSAFEFCKNLESLILPDTLSDIGSDLVKDCGSKLSFNHFDNGLYLGSRENPFMVLYDTVSTDITSCQIHPDCKIIYHEAFSGPCKKFPCEHLKEIVIPKGVERICSGAFACCHRMVSVTFEEGSRLQAIEAHAFYSCLYLSKIKIPDSVSTIGADAFYNCKWLEQIVLPRSLTCLDDYFANCESLEFNTYDGALYLGSSDNPYFALMKAESEELPSLSVHKDCKFIAHCAFYGYSELESIEIPDGVISIGSSAFKGCEQLSSVTVPSGVKVLSGGIFYNCAKLQSVTLHEGVTSIGEHAFTGCDSLTSLALPSTVEIIHDWAFEGCDNLSDIAIPESVKHIGLGAFEGTAISAITVPFGVTKLEQHTFQDCKFLQSVSLPESLTEICYKAFAGCASLESIHIPSTVTKIGSAFSECERLKRVYLSGIPEDIGTFDGFPNIRYNKFDNGLYLGSEENPYAVLIKAAKPNTRTCSVSPDCKVIADYAFARQTELVRVSIPDGVLSIGVAAFAGCTRLRSIKVPESVTRLPKSAFANCENLASVTLPKTMTIIEEKAFYCCEGLKTIQLPEALTEIGSFCFQKCAKLEEIQIPSSVKSIGSYAFYECKSLTEVKIPFGVTWIGCGLFCECENLVSVSFPRGLTSIGEYCCENCSSLAHVYFDGTEEEWKKKTWLFASHKTGSYTLHCTGEGKH
ncbi:MAG: leucine-rich repeat domain-containing protein [Clostridia bacterium]|nr:leucine-rich repeat domain-containing protein [Clostridia bacterium]